MLGYLDALIAALSLRDSAEAQRLLAHPLARLLPEDVVREASAFADGSCDTLAAPLRTMQLRYQTGELLRDVALVPPTVRDRRVARQAQQIELQLSA
jgi:hypothetical protein